MPVKKDRHWEIRLEALKAQNPTWGAGKILAALEQEAAKLGREDAPKERWVGVYLGKLKRDPRWPEREAQYRFFYWPESMGMPDLPWEASAAMLELVQYFQQQSASERPNIRLARWFWRLTLAVPDAPVRERSRVARFLTAWEVVPALQAQPDLLRGLEGFLAHKPWRSEEAEVEYRQLVRAWRVPLWFPGVPGGRLSLAEEVDMVEAMLFGSTRINPQIRLGLEELQKALREEWGIVEEPDLQEAHDEPTGQ